MAPFFEFGLVSHGSAEYAETVALREAVLRAPLGLSFTPAELSAEAFSFHVACRDSAELVGCLVLVPEQNGRVRMRQVAVKEERRRQGIGTALVRFAEAWAVESGFTVMSLHARDSAVPFYERLGYVRLGEPFEQIGLAHWEMARLLDQLPEVSL